MKYLTPVGHLNVYWRQMVIRCLVALVVIAGASATPVAVVDVDPARVAAGRSNCCFANGTPGCDDPTCETAVCASDPTCCGFAWDSICAELAVLLCAACSDLSGACCVANGSPGCHDPGCESAVCGFDPPCCFAEWDSICALEAQAICEICKGPGNDCCIDNGTPGCDDLTCENAVCAIHPFCFFAGWTSICADAAAQLCTGCGGGGPCGDERCGSGENCENCPTDCGVCPPCPWDCDASNDGNVNVSDLLALLAQFDIDSPNNCTGGTCDYNADGCVDVLDLLKFLAHLTPDPSGIGCPP